MQMLSALEGTLSRTVPFSDGTRTLTYRGSTSPLVVSASDGSGLTHTAPSGFTYTNNFAISPDGTRVAFTAKATGDTTMGSIWVMDVQANGFGAPTRLIPLTNVVIPTVSDWGSKGIYYKDRNASGVIALWLYNTSTNTKSTLTPSNFTVVDARYHEATDRVVLIGNYKQVPALPNRLFIRNADGTLVQVDTGSTEYLPESVDWSADGQSLVLTGKPVSPSTATLGVYQVNLAARSVALLQPLAAGTSSFTPFVSWGLIEDPANPTAISLTNASGDYSDTVTLSATLTKLADHAPIAGQTIKFKVNGTELPTTGTTGPDGVATVSYPLGMGATEFEIEAFFEGAGNLSASSTAPNNNKKLTVFREAASLEWTGDKVANGVPFKVSAKLVQEDDGQPGTFSHGETVEFTISQNGVAVSPVITASVQPDGSATPDPADWPTLPAGIYDVAIRLLPNDYFSALQISQHVEAATDLTLVTGSGLYSDEVTVSAKLTVNGSGAAIAGKRVDFKVNGSTVAFGNTNTSGIVTAKFTNLSFAAGTYDLVAEFNGTSDSDYDSSTETGSMAISKEIASLLYTGDTVATGSAPVKLEAQVVQDPDGLAGTFVPHNLKVTFTLTYSSDDSPAGSFTANVDATGLARVSPDPLLPGRSYDVKVTLDTNSYYDAPELDQVIQGVPVITVDPVNGVYSDQITLRATLEGDGLPLEGRILTFKVGSTVIGTDDTNAAGVATVTFTNTDFAAGSYKVTVVYGGDANYTTTSKEGDMNITEEGATVVYNGDDITDGGPLNLKATVAEVMAPADPTDTTPGDITKAGYVRFVVKRLNGTVVDTKQAQVQPDGSAAITSVLTLGNEPFNVEVSLVANDYYVVTASTPGHVKATPNITVSPAGGQYSDTVQLKATFGHAVTGKPIQFQVAGVNVGLPVLTDSTGAATTNYRITQGASGSPYVIKAMFAGDDDYIAQNDRTNSLAVTRENATLDYTGDEAVTGGVANLKATVTQENDELGDILLAGEIQFVIQPVGGGPAVTLTDAVDGTGLAEISTTLTNQPYTVTVGLVGSDYFQAIPATVTETIKATTSLSATNTGDQYSDMVSLVAQLTPAVANKTVAFKLGATTLGTDDTDETGTASLPYQIALPEGSYTIDVVFGGDTEYTDSATQLTLNVTKENATLDYIGDVVSGNDVPINLKAKVNQTDAVLGDITKAGPVVFTLIRDADNQEVGTYTAPVQADGTASVGTEALPGRTYTVKVNLQGTNGYFQASEKTATIRGVTTLAVDGHGGQYSDEVTLSATLKEDGLPLEGMTVIFYIDNLEVGSDLTDASGDAELPYVINVGQGTHTIKAMFSGGGVHVDAEGSANLNVSREHATVVYNGDDQTDGGPLNLKATVGEVMAPADPTDTTPGDITKAGTVRFVVKRLNGNVVDTKDALVQPDGTASVSSIPTLANEPFNVEVSLLTNDYYEVTTSTPGHVKATPNITVNPSGGQYSDTVQLSATFGHAVVGKQIQFQVDGANVGLPVLTDATGTATTNYRITQGWGNYEIKAIFAGDDDYIAQNNRTNTLAVGHEDATLAYTGDQVVNGGLVNLKATVTQANDELGDILLAGDVRFVIQPVGGGPAVTLTDAVDGTGLAQVSTVLTNQPYTVTVSLVGSDYFQAMPPTATETLRATTSLTATNNGEAYSDKVDLVAQLTPAVASKTVEFWAGTTLLGTADTDETGKATLSYKIDLPKGSHIVDAIFREDDQYTGSATQLTLTVDKEVAALAYDGDVVSGNNVPLTLKAIVTQQDDGSSGDITKAGPVVFTLTRVADGDVKTYTAPVLANGTASVTTEPLPGRTYTVKVTLQPENLYFVAPVEETATIRGVTTMTLDPIPDTQYSDVVTFTATLEEDGSPLAGKMVDFELGGTVVGSDETDGLGVATFAYTVVVPAGDYTLKALFDGGGVYVDAEASKTLKVTRENASINYTGTSTTAGGALTLSATVTQPNDPAGDITLADVRFVVRDLNNNVADTKIADIASDGTATITSAVLENRPYKVEVSLADNNYYTADPVTPTVRATTTLTTLDQNIQYSDKITLTATLTDGVGGVYDKIITFKVNGLDAGSARTNALGVATVIPDYQVLLPHLESGSYTITAAFADTDTEYTGDDASAALTVDRETAELVYDGTTVTTGGAITLAAKVIQDPDGATGDITLAQRVLFVVKRLDGTEADRQEAPILPDGTATISSDSGLLNVPYTVDISLVENSYYTADLEPARVKATTALSVTDRTGDYSDKVTLTATLTDGTGGVAGKLITFVVNGVPVGTATTVGSGAGGGVATVTPDYTIGLPVNNPAGYTIEAHFADATDPDYTTADGTGKLTVEHETATLAYTGDTLSTGGPFRLQATLTEEGAPGDTSPGNIANAGQVNFAVKNMTTGVTTDYQVSVGATGVATQNLLSLPSEWYEVTVTLVTNGYYTADEIKQVVQATTTLTASNASGQYSDYASLTAVLKYGSLPLEGRTVKFEIDGTYVGEDQTDETGTATFNYPIEFPEGTHDIRAYFDGEEGYEAAEDITKDLAVSRENASVTSYTIPAQIAAAGPLTLTATVAEETLGDPRAGTLSNAGSLRFEIKDLNGNTVDTQDGPIGTGTVSVTTDPLPNQAYDVVISQVMPNGYYTIPTVTGIRIKGTPNLTLTVSPATQQYSDAVTLTADFGLSVQSRNIRFLVDGVQVGADLTDAGGTASITYTVDLAAGTYDVDAVFDDDGVYVADSADTSSLTVVQENATLAYTGTTFTNGSNSITLSASVTEETAGDTTKGDITLAGPVTFTVTNVATNASTDYTASVTSTGPGTGTATVSPAITLTNGVYTVEVKLSDTNGFYKADSDTATIKATPSLTLSVAPASIEYSDKTTFTVTLMVGGSPVSDRDVTVTIGTTTLTGTTGPSGQVTLDWTDVDPGALSEGTYTAQADFDGSTDLQYESALPAFTDVTVTKESAAILYTGMTSVPGGAFTLGAQLTQQDTLLGDLSKAVVRWEVTRNSTGAVTSYTDAADSNGVASFTIPNLTPDSYTITTRIDAGNVWWVTPVPDTDTIKGSSRLSVSPVTVQYSDRPTLTATLYAGTTGTTTLANQQVDFYIGGVFQCSDLTDGTGVATCLGLQNLAPGGTYTTNGITTTNGVEARYAGNTYFDAAPSGYADLTRTKETVTFTLLTPAPSGNDKDPRDVTVQFAQQADGSLANPAGEKVRIFIRKAGTTTWPSYPPAPGRQDSCEATVNASSQATCSVVIEVNGSQEVGAATHSVYYIGSFASGGGTAPTVQSVTAPFGSTTTLSASFAGAIASAPGAGSQVATTVPGGAVAVLSLDRKPILLASLSSDVPLFRVAANDKTKGKENGNGNGNGNAPAFPPGLVGKPILFKVNGVEVGTAYLDAAGNASLDYRIDLPAGTYTIEAIFNGHAQYGPASGTGTLTVMTSAATLQYTGDVELGSGGFTFRAALGTDSTADLAQAGTVEFHVKDASGGTLVTFTAPVATDGMAEAVAPAMPEGAAAVEVVLGPNGYFHAAPVTVELHKAPALIELMIQYTGDTVYGTGEFTLRATVVDASGMTTDLSQVGTVEFYLKDASGGTLEAFTAPVAADGTAEAKVSAMPEGASMVEAVLAATTGFMADAVTVPVEPAPTPAPGGDEQPATEPTPAPGGDEQPATEPAPAPGGGD